MPRQVKTGLAEKVLIGDVAAAARLISLIEDGAPEAFTELDRLYPSGGKAQIIGVTGAPGVGKSTLACCLIGHFRRQDKTVGVIAIDPSSAITGGALLGDRIRMQRYATDPAVFIRSLATRGWAGGLARAALGTVRVMDALGRDIILVETVGSGQVELDVAGTADTTVLVMAPGAGDDVQAMKAGILEVADIVVINKADREGAEILKAGLESVLGNAILEWQPPVILAEAIREKGIEDIADAARRHNEFLIASGEITRRRRERARQELLGVVEGLVRDGIEALKNSGRLEKLVDDLMKGKSTPRCAGLEIAKLLAESLQDTAKDRE